VSSVGRAGGDGRLVALLGGTVEKVPERYRDAWPLSWIDQRTAPFWELYDSMPRFSR
jgi:hypothetical protein